MNQQTSLQVVTANDLLKGDAVWLTSEDGWTRDIQKAEIIENEALALKRLTLAETQINQIIEPYLFKVQLGPNGPVPVHFRETFRTRGPSNYAHGKQETILSE